MSEVKVFEIGWWLDYYGEFDFWFSSDVLLLIIWWWIGYKEL